MAELTGCERRADERYDVDLAAMLRAYRVGQLPARIRDLSISGAMLAMEGENFARGDELIIAVGSLELVATVAWATDGHRGIVFHRRLDAAALAGLRRLGRIKR